MKSFKQSIDESSLSRVMHHVNHTPKMGILSPHRQEHSDEENERRFSELKKHVRKLGHGYVEMRGGYKEEGGFVKEKSLMMKISRYLIISKKNFLEWNLLFQSL